MAKISFAAPGAPVDETATPAPETQPTAPCDSTGEPTAATDEVADSAVAQYGGAFPFNEDNIGFGDIKFPKLNIVQKSGNLANVFEKGEIILNQQIAIYTPPTVKDGVVVKPGTDPLYVVAIGFRKDRYVEQVGNDSEVQGIICDSLQEVAQAGGTLNYNEHKKKLAAKLPSREFKTLATALFLVRKPKDIEDPDHILFPFENEGEYYVLASYDMKGGAFSNCAEPIRQAKKIGHLQAGGYPSFSWTLGTKLNVWKTGNSSFIPVLKPATRTTESIRALIKRVTGS